MRFAALAVRPATRWLVPRSTPLAARARTVSAESAHRCAVVRSLSSTFRSRESYRTLQSLKRDCREAPGDPDRQVRLARKLEEEQGMDAVISHIEALPPPHLSEAVLREYLRVLASKASGSAKGDERGEAEFDDIRRPSVFRQMSGSPPSVAGAIGGTGAGGRGPSAVHVAMSEPSSKEQVWRTLRTLAGAYLLLLGITTIMEERGLVKVS